MNDTVDQLRYPIGKFSPQESYSSGEIVSNIERIANIPQKVESVFRTLTPRQLETTYREGGWTARQVLHHVADSHMNAYIRIKWTLTEETPLIKAYDEKLWAMTPEINEDPVLSITLLKALHVKFCILLSKISPSDMKKAFVHPETKKQVSIERMIALYAWHGEHHLGHLNIIAAKPK
jgi:hypothetical protein